MTGKSLQLPLTLASQAGRKVMRSVTALSLILAAYPAAHAAETTGDALPAKPQSTSKRINVAIDAALNADACRLDEMYTYNTLAGEKSAIKKELLAALLAYAHKRALQSNKMKRPQEAARILKTTFDLSNYLACLVESKWPFAQPEPSDWLASWKAEPIKLPPGAYVAPLNDYGYFLQELKKDKEALPIFYAVIKEDPEREVAYLNIADSLKEVGQTTESERFYATYKRMMQKENKASIVPARVDTNRRLAITGQANADVSQPVLDFMDELQSAIYRAWERPRENVELSAVIQFFVTRDGALKDCVVFKSSGDANFDKSALRGVQTCTLPALPPKWTGEDPIRITISCKVSHEDGVRQNYPISKWLEDAALSNSVDDHLKLGAALLRLQRFDEAEQQFKWAESKQPANKSIIEQLGRLKAEREGNDKVKKEQERAISSVLTDAARKLARSGSGAGSGSGSRPRSASGTGSGTGEKDRDKAPGKEEEEEEEEEAKSAKSTSQAMDRETGAEHRKLHQNGLFAIDNGSYALAIRELSQALVLLPICGGSRLALSMAYNNMGRNVDAKDLNVAMKDFHDAFCISPENGVAEDNINKWLKKLHRDPSSFSERIKVAQGLAAKGDLTSAIVEYYLALKLHRDPHTLDELDALVARLPETQQSR